MTPFTHVGKGKKRIYEFDEESRYELGKIKLKEMSSLSIVSWSVTF